MESLSNTEAIERLPSIPLCSCLMYSPRTLRSSAYLILLCTNMILTFYLFIWIPLLLARMKDELSLSWLKQKKPYTAITVQVERLTGEQYEADDFGGIVDLIEVLRLQSSGPTEAARALRKKL